jgi:predicted transcriptional regulator
MQNKIFNEFGALNHQTEEAKELDELADRIDTLIGDYFRTFPDLNPIECRCVKAYLSESAVVAETVLRKAFNMREKTRRESIAEAGRAIAEANKDNDTK